MLRILALLLISVNLYADKQSDLKNDTSVKEFLDYKSSQCFGTDDTLNYKLYRVQYQGEGVYNTDSSPKGVTFENTKIC